MIYSFSYLTAKIIQFSIKIDGTEELDIHN